MGSTRLTHEQKTYQRCRRFAPLSGLALSMMAALPATGLAQIGNVDLRDGAVFGMSNARDGNEVVAYSRAPNGRLTEVGFFPTGGTGSGSFEDTAHGLVLANRSGEIAPNNLIEPHGGEQWLFATNAGSNSISVFAVNETDLELLGMHDSAGEKPVSVTVNDGLVYVLNSGETNDSLFDGQGEVIPNCTTGFKPTVSGFKLRANGELMPIPGSTRQLSGVNISGCAQLSFDPSGQVLVVTERFAQPRGLDQQTSNIERLDDEGVIVTFQVKGNGRLGERQVIDATGQGPFGFTFERNGNLLTTEQFDGLLGPGLGAAASYVLKTDDGTLLRSSPSIQNGGTDTCWFVVTDDQKLGFTTSFFGDGRISSYEIDDLGIFQLERAVATGASSRNDSVRMGASDLALSRDSEYLYQLNSINGTISVFSQNADGTLTFIERHTPFPQLPFGPGGGEAGPVGLSAS